MLSEITSFLATIWNAFSSLQVPLLGISFATLYTGVFAVGFSLLILRPILGIAQSAANIKGQSKAVTERNYYTTKIYSRNYSGNKSNKTNKSNSTSLTIK